LPAEADERRPGAGPSSPFRHKKLKTMEMIVSTMTRVTAAVPGVCGDSASRWLGAVLKRWWVAHMQRRLERLAIRQLRAMSDRELKDIGVVRSQIEFSVRSERDRDRNRALGYF
jgi:uncharacterized protein YjiS (DUF1127 family)